MVRNPHKCSRTMKLHRDYELLVKGSFASIQRRPRSQWWLIMLNTKHKKTSIWISTLPVEVSIHYSLLKLHTKRDEATESQSFPDILKLLYHKVFCFSKTATVIKKIHHQCSTCYNTNNVQTVGNIMIICHWDKSIRGIASISRTINWIYNKKITDLVPLKRAWETKTSSDWIRDLY